MKGYHSLIPVRVPPIAVQECSGIVNLATWLDAIRQLLAQSRQQRSPRIGKKLGAINTLADHFGTDRES